MHIVSNHSPGRFEVSIGQAEFIVEAKNHFELLRQLISKCDRVLLISPFLFEDFSSLFEGLDIGNIDFELVTSFELKGNEQIKKPFSIRKFGDAVEAATGKWPSIHLDKTLHAKIYVFQKNEIPFAGIVTSANLTNSGLKTNHETGIFATDTLLLHDLGLDGKRHLDFVDITRDQIDRLCSMATTMSQLAGEPEPEYHDLGLGNILNQYCTPGEFAGKASIKSSAKYYVKVSGVKDEPILPQDREAFDESRRDLWFATAPNNIRVGDCLLDVAVGGRCFLGYYSCASEVHERTTQEKRDNDGYRRWPFYVYGNNLSIHYGRRWFENPLYYDDVVKDFKTRNPDTPITDAGSDHFKGAISFGSSYILVTREFGEFVKQRIDEWG